MASCRLVASSILSSNLRPYLDGIPCSHWEARQWIKQYLNKRGGWADLSTICTARSSGPRTDSFPCRCKVTEVMRSATFLKEFLVRENVVCLMTAYESGLRKMEHLLEEKGPLTMNILLRNLRQKVTEGEEVALGRNRRELKTTICNESAIFAREQSTGLIVLRGVHAVLDPSCCHSGIIGWIEQYLKEHAGWTSIDDMDKVRSELLTSKYSCQCAIRSLLMLPNIRKHFHMQGNTVYEKSYHQSGLQKVTDVLVRNGPQKVDDLLHMLKEAEHLSERELRALGDNKKDFAETISKEPQMFQPLSQSGRVHLKAGSFKPCRHYVRIEWINRYLKERDEWVSIGEITAAISKIPTHDGECSCDISTILLDDKLPFHVQGNQVMSQSLFTSNYERGIKKIKVFLQKNGPQPVGILLNMLKHEKIMTANEEKVTGRNKKELAYTIAREPKIFKFASPPGIVMLRNTHHEGSNQVTKVVEYLEKYLRTSKTSFVKTLLNQVVRHESLSTGCISGMHSLRKLLAAYPDRFLIHGDGRVSLTKSRRMALSDPAKSCATKRYGTSESASTLSTKDIRVGQSAEETAQTRVHSSFTGDIISSKPLDISDKNNNLDSITSNKQRESFHEACKSESSRDLDRGLRFVEKLLESHGPMVLQDIHTSIVASHKLDRPTRRTLGRTPEELLSILLFQKDTFHVIPPSDLVVLHKTTQMRLNPWTTGLKKVEEYLTESRQLNRLVDFIRENLTAKERQVFGHTKKKVKHTLAHYQDIFLNNSGTISLRSAHGQSSKGKRKMRKKRSSTLVNQSEGMKDGEEMDDENPSKKPRMEPTFPTAAGPVVVHVVQTAEEWIQACHPLFESTSSVVGIDCDSKWFVMRQWDGKVIATKIQKYVPMASPPSTETSASGSQELGVANSFGESSTTSQGPVEECRASSKTGDIFHQLLLLLTSTTILKVVFDVQRICAILCEKMPLRLDNVFDIKVANQLISCTSHCIPDPPSFTELCEKYSVTPSAVVHVSCQIPGGVDASDVAIIKNMAVMTCTLIPHFLHKMFRDMKVELLTEHNCIVEELCKAWGPSLQSRGQPTQLRSPKTYHNISSVREQGMSSPQLPNPHLPDPPVLCVEDDCSAWEVGYDPGRCLPKNPNTISVQGQGMSSTQLPNPHLPDPPVLCVEDECSAWEAGYDPGRCLPKNPNTISVQGQEMSLTSTQMPNPRLPDPPVLQAGERCIPWDLIRGQEDVFLRMLAQIQAKNAGCLPKNPNTISVQGQEMSLTRTQMPNPPLPLPPILQAGERCIPWDLIRGQEDVFLRMLAQIQAKNAGCL
eukprot:XP_001197170.1 PREDICTED: uncharacterized protein LOC756996 isoform X1 [Strongylocentrotus purpuratus]